jgi:hypothetical protein
LLFTNFSSRLEKGKEKLVNNKKHNLPTKIKLSTTKSVYPIKDKG